MPSTRAWPQFGARWCLTGLLFLAISGWTQAATIAYCSSDNDAGQNSISSPYMSNGACSDNCRGSYVFAVLQGQNCWCSNYAPGTQEDTSACSESCPGYPSDNCGNTAEGLYAYIDLGGTPIGTSGAGSSSAASSSSASPTPSPSTSTSTIPSSTTARPETSEEPTQVYTSYITATGSVRTVVVTPTSTPAQSDSALGGLNGQSSGGGGNGLSGGAVAGIVIGVALVIGLLIGAIVFFWLRKRHRKNLDAISEGGSYHPPSHASKNGVVPSRQVSQMSSAGLLTKPSRANTAGRSTGGDQNSAGPGTVNSDRNSTHMTVDQRLNPWAIYSNEASRVSNVSLQDNHDYSRQLRVANPDPS